VSATVPGSQVEYWKANYEFLKYFPLFHHFVGAFTANVGYGDSFGGTTALPPYELFFGGGPNSVRGFRESRLGPKDQFGNPYGGNLNVLGRAELIVPMPDKFASSARVSVFYDVGNVFMQGNKVTFYAPPDGVHAGYALPGTYGPPIDYHFSYNNLKKAVGLSVEWLAPLGLFRFSFAFPLNAQGEQDRVTWGDETERFQFSVGQAF